MNKIAVVYRSKSGFTKKYAEWIAKAVNADLYIGNKTSIDDLIKYDTIVYGGALYAVGINGIKLITNNFDKLKDKKLIIFTLGATPVRPEIFEEVKKSNLTEEQQKYIKFFMLRGGFDYNKLSFIDKILMKLLKAKIKSKKNPDADERGMLNSYTHPVDFTNEKNIKPIVDAINS
ncbi:MAG: hypothetical protein K0S55_1377 [Clostridia bacterium]|nr:hypothetical protein [Clostridia bacterium]